MSKRKEVVTVIESQFKGVRFTASHVVRVLGDGYTRVIQNTLVDLQHRETITKVGTVVDSGSRVNVYFYGKEPFVAKTEPLAVEPEPKKVAAPPEWAKAWPGVWAGMTT